MQKRFYNYRDAFSCGIGGFHNHSADKSYFKIYEASQGRD